MLGLYSRGGSHVCLNRVMYCNGREPVLVEMCIISRCFEIVWECMSGGERGLLVRDTLHHAGVLLTDELEQSRAALSEHPAPSAWPGFSCPFHSHRVLSKSDEDSGDTRVLHISSASTSHTPLTIAEPTVKLHCIPMKNEKRIRGLLMSKVNVSRARVDVRGVLPVRVVRRVRDCPSA